MWIFQTSDEMDESGCAKTTGRVRGESSGSSVSSSGVQSKHPDVAADVEKGVANETRRMRAPTRQAPVCALDVRQASTTTPLEASKSREPRLRGEAPRDINGQAPGEISGQAPGEIRGEVHGQAPGEVRRSPVDFDALNALFKRLKQSTRLQQERTLDSQ